MGRTLHFRVLNEDRLSDDHLETMIAVSEQYNTGKFQYVWTCENFYLDPLVSYPDWDKGQNWNSYRQRSAELRTPGLSELATRRQLVAEGVAKRFSEEIRGFTKVGGNEFNALLVYAALLDITEQTPAEISLSDEGEFLLGSLILKGGKARLLADDMEKSWQYWEKQGFLTEDQYGCRTKQEEQQTLLQKYGADFHAPACFCRRVDIADFTDHPEYNAGEIMAGFRGEHWQLNGDFNPFDESMHAIARIHTLLGGDGVTIRIAKKLDS